MRNRIGMIALLASLLPLGRLLAAEDAAPADDLAAMAQRFETLLTRVESAYTNDLRAWRDDYRRSLVQLQSRLAVSNGAAAAVRAELARLRASPDLDAERLAGAPAELAALQRPALARYEALRAKHNRDILEVSAKYDMLLADRQARLSASGNMTGAMAAKAAREQALQHPLVTAAEFEIALQEAEPGKPPESAPERPAGGKATPAEPAAAGPPPVVPQQDPAEESGESMWIKGYRVYGPGQKVPPWESSTAKPVQWTRTQHSPAAPVLVLKAQELTEVHSQRLGGSRSAQRTESWRLRLQLRTIQAAGVLENVTILVQNYVKDASVRGAVKPESESSRRFVIAQIGPEITTVDLKPVETSLHRSRSEYGGSRQEAGKELYGALVSVFSARDELLLQVATDRGLLDVAVATLPRASSAQERRTAEADLVAARQAMETARVAFLKNERDDAARNAFLNATRALEAATRHRDEILKRDRAAAPEQE